MCQGLLPRRQTKKAMSKRINCAESGDVKDYNYLAINLEWLQEKTRVLLWHKQLCIMHYTYQLIHYYIYTCWACYKLAYTVGYLLYYTCKHLRTRDLMSMLSLIVNIVFLHSASTGGLWLKGECELALQCLHMQGSLSYSFMNRWWRQRECGEK